VWVKKAILGLLIDLTPGIADQTSTSQDVTFDCCCPKRAVLFDGGDEGALGEYLVEHLSNCGLFGDTIVLVKESDSGLKEPKKQERERTSA
jgi:hypothetical protein